MTLAGYIKVSGDTNAGFAAKVGVHPITVQNWLSGKIMPSPGQITAIQRETGYAVTANDLHRTWELYRGIKE